MAKTDTDKTDTVEEPEGTVTLVSPSGGEYRTHSPVEITNLVYGQGYRFKDDTDAARLQPKPEDAGQAPDTGGAVSTTETTATETAPTTKSGGKTAPKAGAAGSGS